MNSLNKGKGGEREVVDALTPTVLQIFGERFAEAPKLQRNTLQADAGGFDIVGVDWCALEVKRCETLNMKSWWQQATRQARGRVPVVIYRQSRQPWRVKTLVPVACGGVQVELPVTMEFEDWKVIFAHRTREWMYSLPIGWVPTIGIPCTEKEVPVVPVQGVPRAPVGNPSAAGRPWD